MIIITSTRLLLLILLLLLLLLRLLFIFLLLLSLLSSLLSLFWSLLLCVVNHHVHFLEQQEKKTYPPYKVPVTSGSGTRAFQSVKQRRTMGAPQNNQLGCQLLSWKHNNKWMGPQATPYCCCQQDYTTNHRSLKSRVTCSGTPGFWVLHKQILVPWVSTSYDTYSKTFTIILRTFMQWNLFLITSK